MFLQEEDNIKYLYESANAMMPNKTLMKAGYPAKLTEKFWNGRKKTIIFVISFILHLCLVLHIPDSELQLNPQIFRFRILALLQNRSDLTLMIFPMIPHTAVYEVSLPLFCFRSTAAPDISLMKVYLR